MAYEDKSGLNVNNHYGPRGSGGTQGLIRTAGSGNEASLNFDGGALPFEVVIPTGAVVTEVIDDFATGTPVAFVGSVNVSAADGSAATYVPVPLGGKLAISGVTAGTVIVKYSDVA